MVVQHVKQPMENNKLELATLKPAVVPVGQVKWIAVEDIPLGLDVACPVVWARTQELIM